MPHLSAGRNYLYANAIALVGLIALIAASFGVLSVALVVAAVALPALVLAYIHDHDVWRDEPAAVIGVGFALALVLGVGVGLFESWLRGPATLAASHRLLPPSSQILQLGIVVPVVAFIALLVGPVLLTGRPAFRHPVDEVVVATLGGAGLSLGLSVVVQLGAFSHIQAASGDPAHVAFIALTLGLVQPILFATAAAAAVIALREPGSNRVAGVGTGVALVVVYELVTTLLAPFGGQGIVLTAAAGLALSGVGLLALRTQLHSALLAEAQEALGAGSLRRAPDRDEVCAHCGAAVSASAAFCQVCGTSTAALAPQSYRPPQTATTPAAGA
jgi:hypothetical protein